MIKKLSFILVFLLFVSSVYAILPPEDNPGVSLGRSWGDLACWAKCEVVRDYSCLDACSDAANDCFVDEWGRNICILDREAYGRCSIPCHIAAGACVKSCNRQRYSNVDFDNFRELEEDQGCKVEDRDEGGCCSGYSVSDFGVCCKDGFTARKNEQGVYCDMDVDERVLKNVVISVDSEFDYEKKNEISFSMQFEMVDGDGKKVVSSNMAYPGTVKIEQSNSELKGKIGFEAIIDNAVTDNRGMIEGKLKLVSTDLDENSPNLISMNVYNSELPEIKKSFSFKSPKIKVIDIVKLEKGMQWQDSWATYEVKVFDPYNSKKRYVLGSDGGNLRIEGIEYGDLASYTSNENSLKFGWKAPKITKDMRLNYGTKIVTTAVDLAIKKAEGGKSKYKDKLANKKTKLKIKERLNEYALDRGADTADDLRNVQKGIESLENLEKAIKGIEQEEALLGHITNMKKFMNMSAEEKERLKQNPDQAYAYARMAMQAASSIEGLVGQFGISSFPVSAMLGVTQAFFDITDEMNKIAASKTISKDFKISARVESKKGSNTLPKTFTIEGYEMVLKEETFIPFK